MSNKISPASGSQDNVGSQPTPSQKESGPFSGRGLPWKWSKKRTPSKEKPKHGNIAHDIFNHSIDETDLPYMLLSVIGDSPEFQPKEWSKLSFQAAIMETINRAEECLVMYVQPGLGNTIGSLLEDALKTHSIENDRFLTYRCKRKEDDTIPNSNDTGLCLYSHKRMSVCDLRKSGDCVFTKQVLTVATQHASQSDDDIVEEEMQRNNENNDINLPNQNKEQKDLDFEETRSETMIQLEEYIHGFTIEIEFVEEVHNVPVVLILAEGDITSVKHVSQAVQRNALVYIIQGSGKAADVIADYLQAAIYARESSLKETVARNFGFAFLENDFLKIDVLRRYLEDIVKFKKMITIFDIEREPKTLADMISDSVSSFWTVNTSKLFRDGYIWVPEIYLPLAYRYIQLHKQFQSKKASSLLQRAFNANADLVRRLLDNGTSLRKIYEHNFINIFEEDEVVEQTASSIEDRDNIYRRRLQDLQMYCSRLVGFNTGTKPFSETSTEYISEEQLSELFLFEFILRNEYDMADIFWQRCPNQLMTALILSAFLKMRAEEESFKFVRRLGADLMIKSKSFEERARYILHKMTDSDEEFHILTDKVVVMGVETSPLEFAFKNEELDFLSHSTCQRYLHTVWISRNKKARSNFGNIWNDMVAPRLRFCVSYIFFFLAIICCSVFTLTDVRLVNSYSELSIYQLAFTIWILGDFIEEFLVEFLLEKFKSQVKSYFIQIKRLKRDLWNWLNIGCYISYGFGVMSHFLSTDPEMKITRRLYTLTVVLMHLRFLRIMLMSRHIGTKVIMIAYMTKDLLSFFRILLIIIFGVGVGYHANIYPNFSPLFYDDWGDRWKDARIFSIIAIPYWQIYGDPMLEQLEDDAISYCQSQNATSDCKMDFSVPLTSFLFMMFGNILLINLVIAMFSNRFEEVERNSEKFWNYRYMSIVIEYTMRLPSPINLVIRPLQILFYQYQNKNIFRTRKIGIIENNYLFTRNRFKYQNVTPNGIDNSTPTFQFNVKTDDAIYVGLFGYPPDKKEGEMIEILMQNSNLPVVTKKKKDILITNDTGKILDELKFMEFEISWMKEIMSVYSRTYKEVDKKFCLHRKLIMKASCKVKKINCISYHTSDQSKGDWKFCDKTGKLNDEEKNNRGLQVEISTLKGVENIKDVESCFSKESSTPKQMGYNFAKNKKIQAEDENSEDKNKKIIFRVKAKCDVNLELYNSKDNFDENTKLLKSYIQKNFEMIKVVIGGASNSKSWISYTNFKEVCTDTFRYSGDTSQDSRAKPFWISWGEMFQEGKEEEKEEKQLLKIGIGNEVDIQMIMRAKLNPFKVDFVGVTTSEESEGNWIFHNGITIYTPEEFNYKLVSPVILDQRKTIIFQVKAKCDAHIALCHKLPNRCGGNMYEIVLGGEKNKKSYIRNLSLEPRKFLKECTGSCLDGNQYKTFWISWADGKIQVGKTSLYHDELLSFDYGYEYPVLHLAVSTGPDSNGYWKFDDHTIFQGIKKSESKELLPGRPKIWKYNYDEVKYNTVKVKSRRSQEHFSSKYIHGMDAAKLNSSCRSRDCYAAEMNFSW